MLFSLPGTKRSNGEVGGGVEEGAPPPWVILEGRLPPLILKTNSKEAGKEREEREEDSI